MLENLGNPILIVGGYGVVGRQIAQILRERHSTMPLLLAGRDPARARDFVDQLGNAQAISLDIELPCPLDALAVRPAAVISVANDPYDHLLIDSVRRGIPFVDVTRWTDRVSRSIARLALEKLAAPVIFSSGWMAGSVALVANAYRKTFKTLDQIDIDVLFALADKAGPNSIEYMDRLSTPFTVSRNGKIKLQRPLTEAKVVTFRGGYKSKVYRFDTPDQLTLPLTTGAGTVNARIAFDDPWTMGALVVMRCLGLLKILNQPRFDRLRRSLMYNPGPGAAHEVRIDLQGSNPQGQAQQLNVSIRDPLGQTHLTACAAVAQLEWALGVNGVSPPAAGIHFGEQHSAPHAALALLKGNGVEIIADTGERKLRGRC